MKHAITNSVSNMRELTTSQLSLVSGSGDLQLKALTTKLSVRNLSTISDPSDGNVPWCGTKPRVPHFVFL